MLSCLYQIQLTFHDDLAVTLLHNAIHYKTFLRLMNDIYTLVHENKRTLAIAWLSCCTCCLKNFEILLTP